MDWASSRAVTRPPPPRRASSAAVGPAGGIAASVGRSRPPSDAPPSARSSEIDRRTERTRLLRRLRRPPSAGRGRTTGVWPPAPVERHPPDPPRVRYAAATKLRRGIFAVRSSAVPPRAPAGADAGPGGAVAARDRRPPPPSPRPPLVLVACGSFNPPTAAHVALFSRARDALQARGWSVAAGVLSPVNDAYGKPGLAPGRDRVALCRLAASTVPGERPDLRPDLRPDGRPDGRPSRRPPPPQAGGWAWTRGRRSEARISVP